MPIQRYWILTARKLNGEATPDELSELEALLAQHGDKLRTSETLEQVWQQEMPAVSPEEAQRLLALLEQRVPELAPAKAPARHWRSRLAWAAGLFLLLGAGGYFLLVSRAQKITSHEVVANRGTRSQVTLPDGTLVWLNAGSKLVYDDNYGIHQRLLQLEGEAYFDVARQADIPFEVRVKDATVKVLGTTFNLRAYPEETMVEAALISGSVQLQYKQPGSTHQALLKPGQKLILTRHPTGSSTFTPQWELLWNKPKQPITEIAWKDNTLSFDKESFASLATRLERWYNITVVFEQPVLKKLEFSGSIKGEQINEVMTVLSRSSGQFTYHYNQASRVLRISRK
ncbi:FecR family protein [Chitinophaga sp. 22321]|uniref:FecR domain-containing protein n=1 Tax=Chitinophaga hostae TaxID=2831022 RepID=A0ABS5IVK8_9BACT|nr:FecR domain-containing protein [Chitinophaga hostae]MBS0026993.1 FecR domain-containing protein [Chitinophaga hostae]